MRKFIIDTSSLIDLEKYYPYNVPCIKFLDFLRENNFKI